MIYKKYKYNLLAIEDWADRNFVNILLISLILVLGLTVLILHYKNEAKWYNEQTTYYDNSLEQIKFINKNY